MNNFQQTVNLKKPSEEEPVEATSAPTKKKRVIKKQRPSRAEGSERRATNANLIDEVYQADKLNIEPKPELKQFESVVPRPVYESMYRRLSMILMVLLVATVFYFLFFPLGKKQTVDMEPRWCMVELLNNETYYGQITDKTADPVVISSVYYNYDQLNSEDGSVPDTGNLRLVKRGKETHGPSGTMYIYQVQIKTIDELSQDSKVLQAILNYEN